jgi:hypothetical protein
MIRAIVVVKLPSQVAHKPDLAPLPASRSFELVNHCGARSQELQSAALAGLSPPHDGTLRPANIQGFQILQWRSLPIHLEFGYHNSKALATSPGSPLETAFRRG